MEAKSIIEAALFISSRALSLDEIAKVLGTPAKGYVKSLIDELAAEYDKSERSICIREENGNYVMRLKGDYLAKVKDFAREGEISKQALRTLAVISKENGITKRKLFRMIGSQIYSDCKELTEKGFTLQKKSGRTSALYLTQKFNEYFN